MGSKGRAFVGRTRACTIQIAQPTLKMLALRGASLGPEESDHQEYADMQDLVDRRTQRARQVERVFKQLGMAVVEDTTFSTIL